MMPTSHWGKRNAPLFEIGDLVICCGDEQLKGKIARCWWVSSPLGSRFGGSWEYLVQFSLLPENWYSEDSLSLPDATQQIYRWVRRWCSCLDHAEATEALIAIAGLTNCFGQEVPVTLTDGQQRQILLWLDRNHPQAYTWATGQTK